MTDLHLPGKHEKFAQCRFHTCEGTTGLSLFSIFMKTFADFQAAFPRLYPAEGIPCGFWCPPGWLYLVWELSERLDFLVDAPLHVEQVKAKFGGLRFYIAEANVMALRLIKEAEEESFEICMECGKRAKPCTLRGGVTITLCKQHMKERLT